MPKAKAAMKESTSEHFIISDNKIDDSVSLWNYLIEKT
jgi:hypothetical protein